MMHFGKEFLNPPKECTQIPFWFLNGEVDGREYARQIEEMAEKGVLQAMPHPRFGMDRRDYLTEKYWDAFEQLLKKAEKTGTHIYLYDEYNWSSGPAGGKVTADIKNCALGLGMRSKTVTGTSTAQISGWNDGLRGWGKKDKFIGAAIAPKVGQDEILFNEIRWIENVHFNCDTVSVDIPDGNWEAMVFYTIRTMHPSPLRMGNGGIIDYLSPVPTSKFIEYTHEKYKEHFSHYFGNTIKTAFYDECGPYACGPFTWTDDFPVYFIQRKGYNMMPYLPLLFYNGGDMTEKVRCDYWDILTELFAKNHIGQMAGWCEKNGIALTGHTYEESEKWMVAGNPFRTLRTQHIVGIDSLEGYKPYHYLKPVASIPHITGKNELLCEALGIMEGWNASPRMMKQAYNQLAVIGVTHLVPHAFFQTIDNPKVECPPSFFEHNAYWKYYELIANMTARQCWINRQGHHVADIAVLFPIVSWWGDSMGGRGYGYPWEITHEDINAAEDRKVFDQLINQLMSNQMDLDVIDSEALKNAAFHNGEMKIAKESYKVLIIPPMSTIRLSDLEKILDFSNNGGITVFIGKWPKATMENGRNDEKLIKIISEIRKNAYFSMDIQEALEVVGRVLSPDVSVVEGDRHSIDISHRCVLDNHIYLVSHNAAASEEIALKFREKGQASIWYPETGLKYKINSTELEKGMVVTIKMLPHELAYVVLENGSGLNTDGEKSALPVYIEKEPYKKVPVKGKWSFLPVSSGLERDWRYDVKSSFLEVPAMKKMEHGWLTYENEQWNFWDEWYKPGFDDSQWETVNCLRRPIKSDNTVSILLRCPIPAGASGIKYPLPVSGEHAIYVNGKGTKVILDHYTDNSEIVEAIDQSENPGILAIECASMAPDNGLEKPVAFFMEPVEIELTSWKQLGLGWYSGYCIYRKSINVDLEGHSRVFINLGEVRECAEIWINGQLAGVRLWPPYSIDITPLIRNGENEVIIIVSNLLSNRFSWDVWGSRGKGEELDSGLLGQVYLEYYTK